MSAKQPIPRLLYHTLSATLHQSNTSDSVLTIRFSSPVRIESLRIIPEGVPTLSGIGCTYPSHFSARVLFNVSPSNPINALSGTSIAYDGDKGWDQDFQVGMPEGVSTRMMIVVGKIDRLSLSVYGYAGSVTEATDAPMSSSAIEDVKDKGQEDWSWVSEWAGGIHGLVQMLVGGVPPDKREKAMECLDLLCEGDSTILDQIIQHPTAISYLQALDSTPCLLQRLYDDPEYALHPNLRDWLPYGHRYKALVEGPEGSRRNAAWKSIPDEAALRVLQELGMGDWTKRDEYTGSSRLAKLLNALAEWEGSDDGYALGLDMLLGGIGTNWSSSLARNVTPLIVRSHLLGRDHALNIPLPYSREVVIALLEIQPVISGKNTSSITAKLGQPYLQQLRPSDPLRNTFRPTPPPSFPKETPNDREISRLAESLQSPRNGYAHSLTPSQLLSVLAPELLHSLTTARQPLFGLEPVVGLTHAHPSASASTFAGKVYSSHDFRSRQLVGEQVSGIMGGAGLGINGNRGESRPASRHVDDYLTR
jgi:hypothetical protein